jgi:hypothetical protein
MTDNEYNSLMEELELFESLTPEQKKIFLNIDRKKYPVIYDNNYSCCFNIGMEEITYCGVDMTREILPKFRPDRFIKVEVKTYAIS